MVGVSQFKIRPLRWNDFEDCCCIQRSLNKELKKNPRLTMGRYRKVMTWDYLISDFTELYKEMKTGKATALVAEINGHVVGLCTIGPVKWPDAPHVGELGYYIIKQYRNMGIGTQLVKETLKRNKGMYEIITAGTHSNNAASKALIRKFKFRRYSFGPRFTKRGKIYLNVETFYKQIK